MNLQPSATVAAEPEELSGRVEVEYPKYTCRRGGPRELGTAKGDLAEEMGGEGGWNSIEIKAQHSFGSTDTFCY